MNSSARFLSPSEAAARLGLSAKALRLYEERGLLSPVRTQAGWRAYGPGEMARASEIAALRALGLGLAQIGRVLAGERSELEPALAAHQAVLESRIAGLAAAAEKVRGMRQRLAQGEPPAAGELARLREGLSDPAVTFDLPWPWGGERFELRDIRPITYIIGSLGSGKTRLARRLAEELPGAVFLGLDRAENGAAAARARLKVEPTLETRVRQAIERLLDDGATLSDALLALVAGVEAAGEGGLVVDMVEQGLDEATQQALIADLRRRQPGGSPLFLLTRSSAILDLAALGPDEAIILCPANHSPPFRVPPYRGAPGYEAVETCLAPPEVRARSAGIIAFRPKAV